MKLKLFFTFVFLGLIFSNANSQGTLEKILYALQGKSGGLKDLGTNIIEINSSSKAWLSNGKTRQVIPIELPDGTQKWYYRITVLDINSGYEYQPNETFYNLLINNRVADLYNSTNYGVDFFILNHSGDVSSFLQTGNNNFRSNTQYESLGTSSFIGECNINHGNLWIGLRNPNSTKGLKVIVETVSWGWYK